MSPSTLPPRRTLASPCSEAVDPALCPGSRGAVANERVDYERGAMRKGWRRRWEERRRGAARTGSSATEFSRRRVDAYLRRRWAWLGLIVLFVSSCTIALWFVLPGSDAVRGFGAGVFVAGGVGAMYHWTVLASGAANVSVGGAAEEWTSLDLRRLRRRGWRTLDHLILRPPHDIDHVAIGPDGVIVVETKWRSVATDLERHSDWLEAATRQVRRNERDLAGFLGWGAHADARITPLLVVWGPEITQRGDGPLEGPNGVNVIAGEHLRTALGDLGEAHLDHADIDRIYAKLAAEMDRTDGWALRDVNRPPTLTEIANEWARRALVGVVAFVAVTSSFFAGWGAIPLIALLVAVGIGARAVDAWRRFAGAWLGGVGVAIMTIAGLAAVAALST